MTNNFNKKLLILYNICIQSKSSKFHVQFYVYKSNYTLSSIRNDEVSQTKKRICGVGISLSNETTDDYYYVNGFNINQIMELIQNKVDFSINSSIVKKPELQLYGDSKNIFKSNRYIKLLNDFLTKNSNNNYNLCVSNDFETIVIVNQDWVKIDNRSFQKLFLILNNKVLSTKSISFQDFIGDYYVPYVPLFSFFNSVHTNCVNYSHIILSLNASGLLVHEICSHMLENDYFTESNPFYSLLNKKVTHGDFTLFDRPSVYYNNIVHIDDDGVDLTDGLIISSGILLNLIGTNYSKKITKYPFINRARKENHKFISTGRSYCLCLNPGQLPFDRLYKKYLKSIIILDFQITYFDFNIMKVYCYSKEVYIWKKDKLCLLSGFSVEFSCDGYEILQGICDISDDLHYNEHTCNSSSGLISNSTLTPSIVIKSGFEILKHNY